MLKTLGKLLSIINFKMIDRFNILKKYSFTEKKLGILLFIICLFFMGFFIWQSALSMKNVPFNEFDEAHRSENAKRMLEYSSFLVPLTGSPFDRIFELRIPSKKDEFTFLYYHLERPPLVYVGMVTSISAFGSTEWAYRLPSFVFGLLTFGILGYFGYKIINKISGIAFVTGLACLLMSTDLWLSSQYAQLDTAMTMGLFGALLSLIYYCQNRVRRYLYLSGIFLGVAILSKGQPAIIFLFPVIYLLITKKLSPKELVQLLFTTCLVMAPWLFYLFAKFGVDTVIRVFVGFAFSLAVDNYVHHLAPFFWYIRWWFSSFSPGWALFLILFVIDFFGRNLDWRRITLLTYIFGSLLIFSIPSNKLWWYVLPLVPAMAFYICLSLNDYLKKQGSLVSLALTIFLLSKTPSLDISNRVAMFYGAAYSTAGLYFMTGLRSLLATASLPKGVDKIFEPRIVYFLAFFFVYWYLVCVFPKLFLTTGGSNRQLFFTVNYRIRNACGSMICHLNRHSFIVMLWRYTLLLYPCRDTAIVTTIY